MAAINDERVDLGHVGWVHPEQPGWIFSSKERMEIVCQSEKKDPALGRHEDTRPTLPEISKRIRELEAKALGLTKDQSRFTTGPWDEYFDMGDKEKWPERYRWVSVYVVTGGSEGLYLHIDIIGTDGTRKNIAIAKTCDSSREKWFQCWESAARIARYLHA